MESISPQVQVGAVGASDAVASILQSVGDSAVATGATKAEVMARALGHRVLPPHNPEATRAPEAYKYVAPAQTPCNNDTPLKAPLSVSDLD